MYGYMEQERVILNPTELEARKPVDNKNAKPAKSRRKREIWAVGGGKGGVGKTLITANIGISLAFTQRVKLFVIILRKMRIQDL